MTGDLALLCCPLAFAAASPSAGFRKLLGALLSPLAPHPSLPLPLGARFWPSSIPPPYRVTI